MNIKKLIDFQEETVVGRIQNHANHNHNGNFSKAVRSLVIWALTNWNIKEVKNEPSDD